MSLLLVLLLMSSVVLTGCGGDAEEASNTAEPAAAEEAAAPASDAASDEITTEMLSQKYNEVAAQYNVVYTTSNEKGLYGTDEDITNLLDSLHTTMANLAPVIQAGDSSAEDNQVYYDNLDNILVELGNVQSALESM